MGISSLERYDRKTAFLIGKVSQEVIEKRTKFSQEIRAKAKKRREKYDFIEILKRRKTRAELVLEEALALLSYGRCHKLAFQIQFFVRGYIADIFFKKARLVVELDGGIHKTRQAYDAQRDRNLEKAGYTVIRFTNDEIFADPIGIAMQIRDMVRFINQKRYGKV